VKTGMSQNTGEMRGCLESRRAREAKRLRKTTALVAAGVFSKDRYIALNQVTHVL
jgi:hypothetical protein